MMEFGLGLWSYCNVSMFSFKFSFLFKFQVIVMYILTIE